MEETDGEYCCEWKLTTVDPQERSTWRPGVRSAMFATSQLPVRGPLIWMVPLHLHQKSDYIYSKPGLKGPLKKNAKIDFQYQLSLNAGQKYCRML